MIHPYELFAHETIKRNDLKKRKTVKQHCILDGLCHIIGDTYVYCGNFIYFFNSPGSGGELSLTATVFTFRYK